MRISGLATGMDTETLIRDMMKAHRIPLEKVTQKKQYMEWQLEDYRSINRNLRDAAYKVTDTMGRQATFLQKNVSISNPDAVAIKGLSASSEFAGTIEIDQLATQANLQGGKFGVNVSSSTKLGDLEGFNEQDVIRISAIDKNGELGTFEELKFKSTDTIDTVIKTINSKTGVNAFFDEFNGQIAMTAKNSGAINSDDPNTMEIVIDGQLANVLKLDSESTKDSKERGQNAGFTFNGLTTERQSNTFTINGFEINLKQAKTGTITFSSAPDTDKIVESVVKFVDDYNKMIDELNSKLREPKYRDFQPLSDEQKKDMKEKEIELWEEKAKSGTLRNDPTIANMLTSLRQAISGTTVMNSENKPITLEKIGINLIKDFKANGKLEIDEKTLREKITEDPNLVYELFGKPAEGTDKGGVAVQFRKTMDDTVKAISAKAGTTGTVSDSFTLGRSLKSMDEQIKRFEDRLKMTEDRYWRQFTAMERAIQRSNMQSASLMNAFGGGM